MALQARGRFVVTEPNVYVVGVQDIHGPGLGRFLKDEGFSAWNTAAEAPSEILSEVAGRLCYLSFGGGRGHDEYIENLKRDRHGSVLEHATLSFILTGVSRSFTHECVRHRSGWSYSQLSQRFVDERHAQFVCPRAIADCRDDARWGYIYAAWTDACRAAKGSYDWLVTELDRKLAGNAPDGADVKADTRFRKTIRGASRSVLPAATETKIFCSVNARALRHFLEMRANPAADSEIRLVAMTIYRSVLPFMPTILGDYEVRTDEDGAEYLHTEFIKV